MKQIYIALFVLLPFSLCAQEKIMVIADPHVLAQSLVEPGEAMDNMMASQRKMIDLSEPAWTALMDTALKYQPDLVLIPGDLTKDSEKASHEVVVSALKNLHNHGIRTLVIPGNHDIGGKAYAYKGAERTETENLKDSEWEKQYDWVYEQAVATDNGSHSYAAEPLPGLTVLGIDGSHDNAGTGSLSKETLDWLLSQADAAKKKGNAVLAMCHWQILEHFDMQGRLESACRLKDADAIRDSLMHHGVHLLLTGHFHVNSISMFKDTTGLTSDSIVEISTGSPVTYPCPYRWLTLSPDRSTVSVATDYLTALEGQPELNVYSREWMKVHTANMVPELTLRAWNRAENSMDKITGFLGDPKLVEQLMTIMPQTDEEKIALTEKYFSSTVVELYLVHSDANEYLNPKADSLAQEMYKGMEGMIDEILSVNFLLKLSMQKMLTAIALEVAHEPVQSLVEDVTLWNTAHANRTDDLSAVFRVSEPRTNSGAEPVGDETPSARTILRNGQILIERNGTLYTMQGVRL